MVDEIERDPESKGTVSFSVRLTERQRDLLARAAEIRGWTMTTLLKNAALEKAAHIVNTAGPNRIDFKGIARTVADQIFKARSCRVPDQTGDMVDADAFSSFDGVPDLGAYVYPVEVSPWQMPSGFLDQMEEAARFGGTEFLALLIDAADTIASRSKPDLPDPVDPATV